MLLQDESDDEPMEDFTQDAVDDGDSNVACLYCNELYV